VRSPFIGQNNCPIIERTGDGQSVGRCWFYCEQGVCPRHGNVQKYLERYRQRGELTDEKHMLRHRQDTLIHNPK